MHLEDSTTTIHDFLARPRYITRFAVSSSSAHDTSLYSTSIMQALTSLTPIKDKIKHAKAIRAKLHVRLECNGSPYLLGRLIASWRYTGGSTPLFHNQTEIPLLALTQHSTLMNVKVDPSSRSASEMSLPFLHMAGVHLLDAETPPDRFEVLVLNPVRTNSPTEFVAPTITVLAWMTDVQLSIPTLQSEISGGMSRAAPGSNVTIRGFASTFARTLTDAALTAAGLGAPQLPASDNNPVAVLRVHSDQPQPAISSTAHRLVENTIEPMDPEADPMDFRSIASREAFISRISWYDGTSPSMLAAYPVTPARVARVGSYEGAGSNPLSYSILTPAGAVATCFRHWRGSMKVRVEIVANKFCRGKLRLRYMPRTAFGSLTYVDDVGDIPAKIVDITESTEVEMTVPWMAPTPWLLVMTGTDAYINLHHANGYIVIDAFEGLTSSGAGGIELNVYTSFPDLEVAVPVPIFNGNPVALGRGKFTLQAGQAMDQFYNVRDLIKIQEPTICFPFPDTVAQYKHLRIAALPILRSEPNSATQSYANHYFVAASETRLTRFAFLSACFLGYTGGVRFSFSQFNTSLGVSVRRLMSHSLTSCFHSSPAYNTVGAVALPLQILHAGDFDSELRFVKSTPTSGPDALGNHVTIVDCPNQLPYEFNLTKQPMKNGLNEYPFIQYALPEHATDLLLCQSAADDYALHHFQYVPALFDDN